MSDPYVRIDGDDDYVIEPETWTRIPKFDLWLEGYLDFSELSARDRRHAARLLAGAESSGEEDETRGEVNGTALE